MPEPGVPSACDVHRPLSRRRLLGAAGAAVAVSSLPAAPPRAHDRRPNVLVILTDDQGYGDFSCHGNPVLKTPAMDRLHSQSVRFTDFHSAPMCTPTRGQLLSGLDAAHNRATATDTGRALLRRDIPTMADVFSENGYATAMFGKWHLGDSYPYRPMDRGFRTAKYHLGGAMVAAPEMANDYFNGTYRDNGAVRRFSGYCTDFWFSEAMQWMEERRGKREPFFCYLPTNAPHGPLWVEEKYAAPYRQRGVPAEYFGMVANLDENLARLTKFLDDSGLSGNTLVIFMTDNGGASGVRVFNARMRGNKTQLYDGGHRVPCFVRWPAGRIAGPRDIDAPAQMQDILPTLVELCGLKLPARAKFDGASLAGLLRGDSRPLADRMLVVQYGRSLEKWDAAVIHGKWRCINGKELYDFHADPEEKTDLASRHPDVLARMRAHYEKWWAGLGPGRDEYCPVVVGSDRENPVTLTCVDWQTCGCANSSTREVIAAGQGGPRGGPWGVLAERSGTYEIALRRWPAELNLALDAALPDRTMTVATLKGGKAFPIAAAKLLAGDRELSVKTRPGDRTAVFRVKLERGARLRLHGWFQDAGGEDLCGAYFAEVRRV
jgi:arylsulfatase A-like enzyme